MERKLVSIQVVESVAPIAGADQVEQARVMGWTVVVKKGEFAPGDLCVFFEIDSVLPDGAPWAEFMRPRGFRLRTLRLGGRRGVLSQGLALPTSILGSASGGAPGSPLPPEALAVGADVQALLGVAKYDPEPHDSADIAGPFPSLVPKTGEIRLQSALGVLNEIRGLDFVVTTKLDGASTTFFSDLDGGFAACSHRWELAPGASSSPEAAATWEVAERRGIARCLPPGMALQGEVCGPGIRKNRLGLREADVFAFNVYDARAGRHLARPELDIFCRERGILTVPVEREVRGEEALRFDHSLDRWLEAAQGSYAGTRNRKEGIVVRPLVDVVSPTLGGRLSFKVLNNDFLLKEED